MNIDIEFFKVFCEVARSGNFSKTAEKLYISQPAITQTIKKLEEQLGGKLFYRKNNGVTLTEEGKHLYEYIKDSMDVIENASEKFKQYMNLEEGTIRIRTGGNNAKRVLYGPLLKFSKDFPNIKIDISAGNPDDSIKLLSVGKIDIVILNMPYENNEKNLAFKEIVNNAYTFVMSKEYAEKNNVKIEKVSDLNKYSLIIPKKETTARNLLNQYIGDEELKSNYEMISEEMRKNLALEGLGIAYIMDYLAKEELESGELIEVKIGKEKVESKIGLATLNDDISSFATKKLIEYIMNK